MQELQIIALPLACLFAGCCVGLAVLTVSRIVTRKRGAFETFEESRRKELREASSVYRSFEPLVDELCIFFPDTYTTDQLAHHLKLSAEQPPWKPGEFLAGRTIEGAGIAATILLFVSLLGMPALGIFMGLATGLIYPTLARSSVIGNATKRLRKLKLRLPFAIDQISLMMEAGAGFEDSLRTVVEDNRRHPLSIEFAEVLRQMTLGRPRSQALAGFRDRMSDDDISEIVFAIVKGEELGTPLSSILREQANQMRLKRSQWGEKAASEAEVQMVFPGMITMVACLLVIVAPILLPVVVELLGA
ncbi:MAG: type II secretion system F family protein [Planctomycetaceae bacterium]